MTRHSHDPSAPAGEPATSSTRWRPGHVTLARALAALSVVSLVVTSLAAVATGLLPMDRAPAAHAATTVPSLDHVVWIIEENHAYEQFKGDTTDAPYINNTLIPQGALATKYYAITHPSLPNYMALTGAATVVSSDCSPGSGCESSGPSIFTHAESVGKTYKTYAESMPSNCYKSDSGNYVVHHNPPPYYTKVTDCSTRDVPYSQLAGDFSSTSSTPTFSFVVPNVIDDGHDGSSTSAKIAATDSWLKNNVPTILNSPAFTTQHSLLVITWDEDDRNHGNHVMTIFLGYGVTAGTQDGTQYNHYALLHTTEQALGLQTINSNDGGAPLMSNMFSSTPPPPPGQPTISGFSPTSGPVDTNVAISGSNFTGATQVTFNGTGAPYTVISDAQIDATVPPGATTGPIGVTGPGGSATSSASFTVTTTAPPPSGNVVEDSFHRPDQAQWGLSTNGDNIAAAQWNGDVGTNTHATITNNVGSFAYTGTLNTGYYGLLGASLSGNVDVLAESSFVNTGSGVFKVVADASSNSAFPLAGGYEARLSTSGNSFNLYRDAGGAGDVSLGSTSFTVAANTHYWVRLDVNNGTVAARVWQDGAAEPTTWMLSASDSTYTSGYPGVALEWKSSTGASTLSVENFAASQSGNATPASAPSTITPSNSNVVEDSFARPDQALYGTTSNGDNIANVAWTGSVATDTAHASISGNEGTYTYNGITNTPVYGYLGSVSASGPADVLAQFEFVATGQDIAHLLAFASADGNNHYDLKLNTSTNRVAIYKVVGGTSTNLGSFVPTFTTYAANTAYDARLDITGTGASQKVQGKVWIDGTTEPSSWLFSISDSALSSGIFGVGYSWSAAPSGTGEIDTTNIGAATGGTLAVFADSTVSTPPPPGNCPNGHNLGFQVVGMKIIDCASGDPVALRGFTQGQTAFNLKSSWDAGNRPSTDTLSLNTLQAMANWHANMVRIPVSYFICNEQPCTNSNNSNAYLSELDTVVNNARSVGLYVDLVEFDDNQSGGYTDGFMHPEDVTFMQVLASRYLSDPYVILEPINEPTYNGNLGEWQNGCSGCSPVIDGYNQAIAAIRGTGSDVPIVIAHDGDSTLPTCTNGSGTAVDTVEFGPNEVGSLNDTSLIYTAHWYKQNGLGDASSWSCVLSNLAGKVPVYIGEDGWLPHGARPIECSGLTSANADSKFNAFTSWLNTGGGSTASGPWWVSITFWNYEPVQAISDSYTTYTATTFDTGTWTCDDGSAAANAAGEGTAAKNWFGAIYNQPPPQ